MGTYLDELKENFTDHVNAILWVGCHLYVTPDQKIVSAFNSNSVLRPDDEDLQAHFLYSSSENEIINQVLAASGQGRKGIFLLADYEPYYA